jgi:hypothetical protein
MRSWQPGLRDEAGACAARKKTALFVAGGPVASRKNRQETIFSN